MSESQYNSGFPQPPLEHILYPQSLLPQTPASPLPFWGHPDFSPTFNMLPGFYLPSYSPLCSPALPQASQQQIFFPTSPPPLSPGPVVMAGGGGDFCHVCGPPGVQGCASPPIQPPPQAPPPGYWGAYQQLPPLSPLSPSINASHFPPMPVTCPPPPPFAPMQPPPPPPPSAPATQKNTFTKLRPIPNLRQRPPQPISIFNSPFKRFTQFRGTPSPVVFPMRQQGSRQRREMREEMSSGGREGWYKEGARWGHGGDHKEQGSHTLRKVKEKQREVSAAGETPDLVRDCNEVARVEEISSE